MSEKPEANANPPPALERVTFVGARDGENVDISFAVRDVFGATHFHFRLDEKPYFASEGWITCAGVETHFATPPDYMADQEPHRTDCSFTLTGKCWHDGTSLWAAEHWVPNFKRFGTDWVWEELERTHKRGFHSCAEDDAPAFAGLTQMLSMLLN